LQQRRFYGIVTFVTAKKGGSGAKGLQNYERVPVSGLKKNRKGKHRSLVTRILENLKTLPPESAVRIPLSSIGGVSVLNLRSAVSRATAKENIKVATSADDESFYVWKI
jgi:hypothetical protein